jgi:hypothetical protein
MKKFEQWLKRNLTVKTSSALDRKIIQNTVFKNDVKTSWIKPSFALVFSIVIILGLNHSRKKDRQPLMTESSEMILHYKEIELMVETGSLTEDEWQRIENLK